jgi:protein-S-isoprenylcysteine O-methyltransferase Ste14
MRTLELKIPPVVIGLGLGAAMYAAARFAPVFGFALPAGRIIAVGLAVIGVFAAVLGVVSFRRAGTTVNPLQPAAASQLVVSGIYRRTRNPMYLGMLLVLLGWGVFLANAIAFLAATAFIPLMNRLQIGPEERILTATFGPAFTAYQSAVRRWL